MTRLGFCLIVASLLFGIGFLALLPAERYVFENWLDITPLAGTTQQEWLQTFTDIGFYMLLIALMSTFFWHIAGYFKYRIIDWTSAGGWRVWFSILVIMTIVIIIFGYWWTDQTQDVGRYFATAVYVFNGVLVFWLSSLILSPSTVKYAPPGTIRLKKLWN